MRFLPVCIGILLAATAADSLAIPPGPHRFKGHTTVGDLAEYERGAIDVDALLAQYCRYGLPLPPAGARMVKFARGIWEVEGPMQIWHIGCLLPPLEVGGDEQPVRILVGADVFRGIDTGIRAIDRVLDDGTVVKAKQFDIGEHIVDWKGEDLEGIEFIYHGQEPWGWDSNALVATALQLHHLGDPRAERLLRESLRFDEDHFSIWVSDYRQPAGWSAAEVIAETAWRITVNRWYRGEADPRMTHATLAKIVPDLPVSQRAAAEKMLAELDPELVQKAKGKSLASAVIAFGLSGDNWQPLVERVKQEESAFEILLGMLEDDRVLPFLEIPRREEWTRHMRPKLRAWPRHGRFRRVGDYAALLLDTVCDDALLGVDSAGVPNPTTALAARARLWREMVASEDPASFLRERWFQPGEKGGSATLNRPAIELQILTDFECFRTGFPVAFAEARPPRDVRSEFLAAAILNGGFYAERFLSAAERKERREKRAADVDRRCRVERLFDTLYRECSETSKWGLTFLRELMRFSTGEGGLEEKAVKKINSAREPIPPGQPYAQSVAASCGAFAFNLFYQKDIRPAVLELIEGAPPGLAIEILYRATGEERVLSHYRLDTNRRDTILVCWRFLDDHRSRDIAAEPDRFRGACLPEFQKLRVADFAALRIGRDLNLPWQPLPSWDRAEWDLFHDRVRKAVLRLDRIIIHGIFDREDP